jgi:ATP-dependent helicase HrpA
LRVLTNADLQQRVMRGGVRRLLLLSVAPTAREVLKGLTRTGRLAIAAAGVDLDGLVSDCASAAVDTVLDGRTLPWDADAFAELQRDVRREASGIAAGAMARAGDVLVEVAAVRERLARLVAPALQPSVADATAQLDRLVRPGFVRRAGTARLDDVGRYVRAIGFRLDRLAADVGRDRRRMAEVVPLEDEYAALVRKGATGAAVVELGWRLEELRVSTFAQPIGAKGSVSTTKLRRELAALG